MSHSPTPGPTKTSFMGWTSAERPLSLFQRFSFGSYRQTRVFLDEMARLSESLGVAAQNINFGTTYVNVTLTAEGEDWCEAELSLARGIESAARSQAGAS